jgi:tetratricopeptide (TPR) repeat protein
MERWDDAEEVLIPLVGSANLGDSMNARSNLAQVAYLRGERDRAHRLFTRVNTSGMDFLFAESSYFLAQIALVKGDNTSAQSMFTAAASTEDRRYAEMARVALAESFAIVEGDQSVGGAEETERNRAPEIDNGLLKRAEDGDILAWNDLGHCLIEAGQREEGLTWLERSARAGVPWALSNYNWQLLLEGEHERAVALFDVGGLPPGAAVFARARVVSAGGFASAWAATSPPAMAPRGAQAGHDGLQRLFQLGHEKRGIAQ